MDEYKAMPLKLLALKYGYMPPVVVGSCGATGSNSNNIFTNNYEKLMKTLFGNEWFECPECGYKADGPVGNSCPKDRGGCGLTKEKYAKESKEPICA